MNGKELLNLGLPLRKTLSNLDNSWPIAAERLLAEVIERFRVSVAGSLDCVRATQSASCRFQGRLFLKGGGSLSYP
jgi:hypothetical protein